MIECCALWVPRKLQNRPISVIMPSHFPLVNLKNSLFHVFQIAPVIVIVLLPLQTVPKGQKFN